MILTPCRIVILLVVILLPYGVARRRPGLNFSWIWKKRGQKKSKPVGSSFPSDTPILLLDVDNTLYRETECGIELQIINGIYRFSQENFGLTPAQAQDLHAHHGSTIQGLMETHRVDDQRLVAQFYNQVYQNVSVSALLQLGQSSGSSTGYSHSSTSTTAAEHALVKDLLQSLAASSPALYITSNSPRYHVEKVIQALGLANIPFDDIITPDSHSQNQYPTKATPMRFFGKLLSRYDKAQLHLLDDSTSNLDAASDYMQTYCVHGNNGGDSLTVALCRALGFVPSSYIFSQVDYLRAKNQVDLASLNRDTYLTMIHQVATRVVVDSNTTTPLVIADVGAGLLSMLRLLLLGHGDLPALMDSISSNTTNSIHYYAYEPNRALESSCLSALQEMGFVRKDMIGGDDDDEHVYVRTIDNQPDVEVHLRFWDFQDHFERDQPTPLLVVGCCFADLLDPDQLARSILQRFPGHGGADERMLVYLPITFRGTTQFVPSKPFEARNSDSAAAAAPPIPSDTCAFACYARALEKRHGHNLDPDRLVDAIGQHGGKLLRSGPSDWRIDPIASQYLWEAMMYFFGTVACPELRSAGWNAKAWIERARTNKPTIYASNFDLLFSLPPIGSWRFTEKKDHPTNAAALPRKYSQIEFTAPNAVRVVDKEMSELLPDQVRIQTMYSLISSGTELKIFTGSFDDAALDVNIKSLTEDRMAYPLTYGYCAVGTVVECGSAVQDAKCLVGKLVFAFAPHGSQVLVDRDAIQIVPEFVEPIDAIFMPSVETALSLVQEASVKVGERVVVFGQGLIGLLVTAILARSSSLLTPANSITAGTLTTIDTIPARLAASAMMGSHEVILPENVTLALPFDVSIEVSGSSRALQSAIDSTRDGGRVVIGSWYGNSAVCLNLGIDFHRSKKTLVSSQVSTIPASLSFTWDKQRRFQLAWELVRLLRPSRLVSRECKLGDAQTAYESLRDGNEIAVAFDYRSAPYLEEAYNN